MLELFVFYAVAFQHVPQSSQLWGLFTADFGKWSGLAGAAMVLGWLYYFFDFTHKIDERTLGGMKDIHANITRRLTEPFCPDPVLSDKINRLDWRAIRRIFFRFIDETPSLKTSNDLAFLSGLAFYSFIDLAAISCLFFVASAAALATGFAAAPIRWYMMALGAAVAVSVLGARAAIRKHKETSNLQLDAILSDYQEELRKRLNASV